MAEERAESTIRDFGEQWTHYTENPDYYGSSEVLEDLFGPLLSAEELRGKNLADVGAGTGRYTRIFHRLGAGSIVALEPSDAFLALERNTAGLDRVRCLRARADEIPDRRFDWVFCIGVLQFIPDPAAALKAMGEALGSGGRLFLWVYGVENNRLYLALARPLRAVTRRLPHRALDRLAALLAHPAGWYASLCRSLPLPMAEYMRRYYSRLDRYSRKLVIYDQLNPSFAHYYRREELRSLLEECGYRNIRMHHRLKTSWSVIAEYGEGAQPAAAPTRDEAGESRSVG